MMVRGLPDADRPWWTTAFVSQWHWHPAVSFPDVFDVWVVEDVDPDDRRANPFGKAACTSCLAERAEADR